MEKNRSSEVTGSKFIQAVSTVYGELATVAKKRLHETITAEKVDPPDTLTLLEGEEIPEVLRPTIFVVKPGPKQPTLDRIFIFQDNKAELKNIFGVILTAHAKFDEHRLAVARYFSRYVCGESGSGEDDEWQPFRENLFVIGWEHESTRMLFKHFIKELINRKIT